MKKEIMFAGAYTGIDVRVRKETAFKSLFDMCNKSVGSYTPTLRSDMGCDDIADAFDAEMRRRGIDKKASR